MTEILDTVCHLRVKKNPTFWKLHMPPCWDWTGTEGILLWWTHYKDLVSIPGSVFPLPPEDRFDLASEMLWAFFFTQWPMNETSVMTMIIRGLFKKYRTFGRQKYYYLFGCL